MGSIPVRVTRWEQVEHPRKFTMDSTCSFHLTTKAALEGAAFNL